MSSFLSMTTLTFAAAVGLGSIAAGFAGGARAQGAATRVGEPVAHDNLAVYFLRGTSAPGPEVTQAKWIRDSLIGEMAQATAVRPRR